MEDFVTLRNHSIEPVIKRDHPSLIVQNNSSNEADEQSQHNNSPYYELWAAFQEQLLMILSPFHYKEKKAENKRHQSTQRNHKAWGFNITSSTTDKHLKIE